MSIALVASFAASAAAAPGGAGPAAARLTAGSRAAVQAASPGARLWLARFTSQGAHNDDATALAVSPAGGRIFVTGRYAGLGSNEYGTVAYDAGTGRQLWAARYRGIGLRDNYAESLAVSADGSRVFVTGSIWSDAASYDYATVAYSASTGKKLWAAVYNGPGKKGHDGDRAHSVAVSPSGTTVFVTGESKGATSGTDYATVAYSALTGTRLWVARYSSPGAHDDAAYSVAASPGGRRVFVTGSAGIKTATMRYVTMAYNAGTGQRLWLRRHRTTDGVAQAVALAVSPGGDRVFVTGAAGSVADRDFATLADSASAGAQLWSATYSAGPSFDLPTALAVSPSGDSVFVTGRRSIDGGYATVAYDASTGTQRWASQVQAHGAALDVAVSGSGGTVYVTGTIAGGQTGDDYATVAYSAATGSRLWLTRYHGPDGVMDAATSMAAGPGGKVFVTGASAAAGSGEDYVTIAYQG